MLAVAAPAGSRAAILETMQRFCAAPMQETIDQPLTVPAATSALVASAERAGEWAGEPFLHPDEDAAQVLAPGTARRLALAGMLTELIAAAQRQPEAVPDELGTEDEFEDDEEEEADENGENGHAEELEPADEIPPERDPGAIRRYRFRHPTA